MLRRVALVRTDVSEELSALIVRVTRIVELGKKYKMGFYIPEDGIFHCHAKLTSYGV
jgi:hypothetical protein